MTKQKMVIKVATPCVRCMSKALALAAATCGVDSVALAGEVMDQVVVVGDGVDSVKLTRALRKKVGATYLVHVSEVKKEKEKKKPETEKKATVMEYVCPFNHYYDGCCPPPAYHYYPAAAYSCPPPAYHHYPAAAYSCHDQPAAGVCSIM